MISNKLVKVSGLCKFFTAVPKYSFAKFPNDSQRRWLKTRYHHNYIGDDLAFPHSSSEFNGGIQAVANHYKKNPDLDVGPSSVANLMYNCAVANVYEPLVFEEIERHLHKYEDNLRPRWAFGCLYGAYKTNASTRTGIEFFQNEVVKNIKDLSYRELTELIEASSYNKHLSLKEKTKFIDNNILPPLLEKWEKKASKNRMVMILLFDSLQRMEYQEEKLWTSVLAALRNIGFNNAIVIHIYESLIALQKAGFIQKDVSEDIQYWKERVGNNVDRKYRYNAEEQRWYSFQELKAQRETYLFTDQKLRSYAQELTEEERKRREEEEEKAAEEERQSERERILNEIVKDRYVQLARGDKVTDFTEMFEEEDLSDTEEMKETEKIYTDSEIKTLLSSENQDPQNKDLKNKLKAIKLKKAREEATKKPDEEDE